MNYEFVTAFAVLFIGIYLESRHRQQQMYELRQTLDAQFSTLRHEFAQMEALLKWVEPQVPGLIGHTAVRHTGITSVEELISAVNAGRYKSALVPWTTIRAPVDDGVVQR
jgi:hypothetical protein